MTGVRDGADGSFARRVPAMPASRITGAADLSADSPRCMNARLARFDGGCPARTAVGFAGGAALGFSSDLGSHSAEKWWVQSSAGNTLQDFIAFLHGPIQGT